MISPSVHRSQTDLQAGAEVGPAREVLFKTFASVKPELERVEARMRTLFKSDAQNLTTISSYLMNQGGKRVRPVLCILTHRLFKQPKASEAVLDVSAGIELIHMATLLHDDIIDESLKRRHQKSAYAEFGLTPSLLTGDFLLVRAFGLCALLDDFTVTRTEKACVELTEGELLEGTLSPGRELSLEEYSIIVKKKTASLFSLATEIGAHYAGCSENTRENMRRFGELAGIAFQMVDDILDITADEDLLGKPAGTDLKQRTPSLINVLWLESGDARAVDFFSKETLDERDVPQARDYLASSEILPKSKEIAENLAQEALGILEQLPEMSVDLEVLAGLRALVEYTIERCR